MEVLRDKARMQQWSRAHRENGARIALVPTMGYLHQGHLSLVEEAKRRADKVVVSIYVNPGQFAPGEDLDVYPSDFDGDLRKLEPFGVDAVFNPLDLYVRGSEAHETWIRVENLEKPLCGKSRPLFFRGVATIVAKLLNIVEPDVILFGKKDYQQWRVIRRMVRDLDFGVQVVACPLVREADGLAMSSRNVRLPAEDREKALSISRSLEAAKLAFQEGERSSQTLLSGVSEAISNAGGRLDYATVIEQETLEAMNGPITRPAVIAIAAWFGDVRLLDNMELSV